MPDRETHVGAGRVLVLIELSLLCPGLVNQLQIVIEALLYLFCGKWCKFNNAPTGFLIFCQIRKREF